MVDPPGPLNMVSTACTRRAHPAPMLRKRHVALHDEEDPDGA